MTLSAGHGPASVALLLCVAGHGGPVQKTPLPMLGWRLSSAPESAMVSSVIANSKHRQWCLLLVLPMSRYGCPTTHATPYYACHALRRARVAEQQLPPALPQRVVGRGVLVARADEAGRRVAPRACVRVAL